MKNLFLLFFSVAFIISCDKGEIPYPNEEINIEQETSPEPHIGIWKLMKVTFVFGPILSPPVEPEVFDFSEMDVTFEFRTDNILIVKGKMNHPDWEIDETSSDNFTRSIYFEEGTYPYSISDYGAPQYITIRYDGPDYHFSLYEKEGVMHFGRQGGFSLEFNKVKKDQQQNPAFRHRFWITEQEE